MPELSNSKAQLFLQYSWLFKPLPQTATFYTISRTHEVFLMVYSSPEAHPSAVPLSVFLCRGIRLQFGSTAQNPLASPGQPLITAAVRQRCNLQYTALCHSHTKLQFPFHVNSDLGHAVGQRFITIVMRSEPVQPCKL